MSSQNSTIGNSCQFEEFVKDVHNPSHKQFKVLSVNKTHEISIRDYIGMIKKGLIKGYEGSRGDANIDAGHVNRIMSDFDLRCLGQIQLAVKDNKEFMEITNGNHRTAGLLQWFKAGLLPANILDSPISVVAIPEKDKIMGYIRVNTQRGLQSADHYSNKDLVFGDIIKNEILPYLSDDDVKILNSKSYYAPLAYIIFSMNIARTKGYEVECYQQIYARRQEIARDYAKKTKEQSKLHLTVDEKRRLTIALQYYCDYFRALEQKVKTVIDTCKLEGIPDGGLKKNRTVFYKSSWFGAIVTDFLFNGESNRGIYNFRLATVRPETLADRCIRKHIDLRDLVPRVTGSTVESVSRTLNKIIRILGQPN